jgi:nucleoside-triphosphatase
VLLTGEAGCGKTTVCKQVVSLAQARGLAVSGVVTLPRLVGGCKVGLDAEDIRTGQRHALAERVTGTDGPATENWHFHADGLVWGTTVLHDAPSCDLLVIDEIGPLELVEGAGWTVGLELLRAGRYRLALVVVRPALLLRLSECLGELEPLILTVTQPNRDALPGEIVALLLHTSL